VTFRTKLLFISSFTVAGAVALVTGAVSISTRRVFERVDTDRREALLSQFRGELAAQSADIARRMDMVAKSPGVQQIAAGAAEYDRAQTEAAAALDFLDVVQPDLTIISSAHWPARFGYKNDWHVAADDWRSADVFLARVPTPEGSAVALIAVRPVSGGKALAVGGRRLTPELLKSLGIAPGMRALLWVPPGEVIDAQERGNDPNKLNTLIQEVREKNGQATGVVQWTADRASAEGFVAFPLMRAGALTGVLLAGTSLGEQMALERSILWTGVVVAASGIVIGILLGWWTTERITKPVERLAAGARAVAGGDLSARVEVLSHDEIGELARAFNRMTEQLLEQRERAIQAERVAAWRELARRLAHELKNPLFPLQITIENLQRARGSADFDEVFAESTATLLTELGNLKTIIGRFSDFAKMPTPQFESVDVNDVVRSVMKLNDARFQANGRPKIELLLELDHDGARISADPEQLRRALGNLVLNAMDAMPEGGTLRVRTARTDSNDGGGVRIEISDSGQGLTEEECGRLFTPYYTTKQHGTGLGLAIVQSVVSDHQGKIAVVSQPGRGATFVIDLPENHIQEAAL
jgi:two-component system nitrogen regulation sensor histidine kinase NtrY